MRSYRYNRNNIDFLQAVLAGRRVLAELAESPILSRREENKT
jgi:hypothetical protein